MSQMELFPDGQSGRTSQEPCLLTLDEILQQSSTKWLKQGRFFRSSLCWMRSTSESPSDDGACSSSLASILQQPSTVPTRYYLSAKACEGILRRANRRGKQLPERLQKALEAMVQSHHAQMFIAEEVSSYDGYNQKLDSSGIHRSLRIGRDSSDFVAQPTESTMAVRRLTPLECERLMGWPDDHTRWKADGSEQADTHRYKQCGNGVATPVAKWIAKHILKANQ